MAMVNSIIEDDFNCNSSGKSKYAGGITLNKKLLLVGDEMQDLDENYARAVLKICRDRYVDFYMVGDVLQSIKTEKNSFTFLAKTEFPNTMKLIRPVPENKVMRFGDTNLIDFVNSVVPFEKHNLPKIKKHQDNKDDGKNSSLIIFEGKTIYANSEDKCGINIEVQTIMNFYKDEVKNNNCKPEDFLIVTPFTKKNPLVEALHLEIRDFWKDFYKNNKYEHYSIFHKSEDGSTIDLDESKYSTRIVSIHTSKGDGRNVVFVIGLTEDALKKYSEEVDNLIYDSLLHVALTRMKKRLYVRVENNGDDISRKLLKHTSENITSLSPYIDFSKKIDLEKLMSKLTEKNYGICRELVIKNTEYKKFKEENDDIKEMVDMKHHDIRTASLHILFLMAVANSVIVNTKKNKEFIPQQMYPILKKCITNKVVGYENTKDYNKSLFNGGNNEMPILIYSNGEYKQVYKELAKKIESNKSKLKILIDNNPKPITLDVIESICLYHTLEVCENKFKSILPITDMYDIINLYTKSSPDEKEKYLKSHYLKLKQIENIYQQIDKKYPKMKWLWSHYSEFKGESTCVKIFNSCHFIAHNAKHVIICRICPQFNELNHDKIVFDSIFDIFLLKNSKDDNGHFSGKKIIMCVVTLDKVKPFYVDFGDLLDVNKKNILCMMKNNIVSTYSIKNKGLFLFYSFYKKEYSALPPYDAINKIVDGIKKIVDETNKSMPEYVFEFFDEIKFSVKMQKGVTEKEQKILDQYDDEEIFMSEINCSMDISLNRFFGINKEDLENFGNIKCTEENIEENTNIDRDYFSSGESDNESLHIEKDIFSTNVDMLDEKPKKNSKKKNIKIDADNKPIDIVEKITKFVDKKIKRHKSKIS
jgi:hypothetical protein